MQYFLPFEKKRINKLIEQAILEAQDEGVRVISLGALNKVWPLLIQELQHCLICASINMNPPDSLRKTSTLVLVLEG